MYSQFRNSNLGFALYTIIIFIIAMATGFVIWYMTIGYRVGTFGPETRLGNVYIGGLSEDEVVPLLDTRINEWYNDETIVFELTYQGYSYTFDRSLLLFDLELSSFNLENGVTNELVVLYQNEDLAQIQNDIAALPELENVIDNIDLTSLINQILDDASLMKSYSSQHIEDYIIDPSLEIAELYRADFRVPEGVQLDQVLATIDTEFENGQIPVQSKRLFDVLDVLGNDMNDQEITMLAASMMESILYTNFIINEVHYDSDIDFTVYNINTYPYFGHNTVVNRVVSEGFSFYNPNDLEYYFTVELVDENNGTLVLHGIPFEYDIDIDIEIREIDYVTETDDTIENLQTGHNGAVVEVTRTITDVNGLVVSESIIVFEYYPPIKQIVFQP